MTKTLHIPAEQIKSYGCAVCIWKANSQCPYGYIGVQKHKQDICIEYADFMASFDMGTGSVPTMWENFNLFIADLQQRQDYLNFKNIEKEIQRRELKGDLTNDERNQLRADRLGLKLFWIKLNENVIKGYKGINDRLQKVVSDEKPRITVQQVNILMNENAERLLEHRKKQISLNNNNSAEKEQKGEKDVGTV